MGQWEARVLRLWGTGAGGALAPRRLRPRRPHRRSWRAACAGGNKLSVQAWPQGAAGEWRQRRDRGVAPDLVLGPGVWHYGPVA